MLKQVEQADVMCYIFSTLYVWLSKYYVGIDLVEDTTDAYNVNGFKAMVKADMDRAWNQISVPSMKVDTGYQIAKVLSKISMKNEANEYAAKATDVRKNQWLTSDSVLNWLINSLLSTSSGTA